MPLQLNQIGYGNDDPKLTINPQPFSYKDVIYLPLTREIAVEEFGWEINWTKKIGLEIDTTDPSKPILFDPSQLEQQAPFRYMKSNPYDYDCDGENYAGIKNKSLDVAENNKIVVKVKGKELKTYELKGFGGIWGNSDESIAYHHMKNKGITNPDLNGNNFTFMAVSTENEKTKEIRKENIYFVTVDITNGNIVSAQKYI